MSKKQTAEEFVMDFKIDHTVPYIVAKKCALVAIDKTINLLSANKTCAYILCIEEYEDLKLEIERL